MHLKETGGIEKLFSLGATSMYSKSLQQVETQRRQRIFSSTISYSLVIYT
jgi:hypothetical protein